MANAACVSSILLLAMASWWLQQRVGTHARAETELSLRTALETTHQAVTAWIQSHEAMAAAWADTPAVRAAAQELARVPRSGWALVDHPTQQRIRRLMQPVLATTGHDEYFIVSTDGVNLASSRDESVGWHSLLRTRADFLRRIRAGETATSLPQPSTVVLRDRDGSLRSGLSTMYVGAPILDDSGALSAIFALRIDPRKEFANLFARGYVGSTGETYAFNGSGRLISSSRFQDQLEAIGLLSPGQHSILNVELRDPGVNLIEHRAPGEPREVRPLTRMARSATVGESGSDLAGYRDYRGVPVVGAWTWDPSLGMGMTTEINAVEAFAKRDLIRQRINLLTLVAMMLMMGLAAVFVISRTRARKSDAVNRSVLRSLISHIAVLDGRGNITAVNEAWERFARDNGGRAPSRLGTGVNYLDVCRGATGPFSDEAQAVAAGIESVLERRETLFTLEYPCHSSDRKRWFLLYATPLSSVRRGAVVAHIDITERKTAELEVLRYQNDLEHRVRARSRELVASEERLRDLYDNAPIGYLTVDTTDGSIVTHNRALDQLLDYPHETLAELSASDLYADTQDSVMAARRIRAMASNGQPVRDIEMRLRRRDGALVWVSVSMTPKTDGAGRVVQARCAILDISARKRAEQRLRLTQKVFEETAEAILITDASKRIVEMNDAFCAMTGYERADLLGQTPALLSSGRHNQAFYRDMWSSLAAEGHWQGEIWDRRKDGEAYPNWTSISAVRDAAGDVSNYVGVFSDITTIKETEHRLEQLAHFDQLTGLANRMLFHDRLRSALAHAHRQNEAMAVIYIDLDGFKQVNDSLGHGAGDELLERVAAALRECVREDDTLARLGGDEFAIILGDLDEMDSDVESVAKRVVEVLRISIPAGERELQVTGSVGIALYPGDGQDAETILRKADQAMYQAKESGKDGYVFFDPTIDAESCTELISSRLRGRRWRAIS